MIGLMTLWFGSFIELEPAHGYFHLCPTCYGEQVEPHLDDVQGKLAHLHPAMAAHLEGEQAEVTEGEPASDGDASNGDPSTGEERPQD